jgi:N-acetylglutamate synthase-like GNAT family acetyltransferase
MAAINYAREKVEQVRADIEPLLRAHYEEIGQRDLTMRPDWDAYRRAEAEGRLFILTARIDGELIGYNVMLLSAHLHYADAKCAHNDAIYVRPENRRGRIGLGLIRHFESAMRGCGFDKIFYHAKPCNDFSALLSRLGYEAVETIHAKSLKGAE